MKNRQWAVSGMVFLLLAACGSRGQDGEGAAGDEQAPSDEAAQAPADETTGAAERTVEEATGTEDPAGTAGEADAGAEEPIEIVPGLTVRVLEAGSGETAESGQTAVVHYTGWLYDPEAADHRGKKFDSSVDGGRPLEFPLGAGAVIEGWDKGVAGMQIGEVRELTIAPELAYGERGARDVIPPGATLVFEVELIELRGGEAGIS